MLAEALHNYNLSPEKNIFYLECPTGGGKTNISLALTTKMIQDEEVRKIIHVFPFNKISEQTEQTLINSFHLDEHEIAMLGYDCYKEVVGDKEKSVYETDMHNNINNNFMNYPILLMSHVRLFDILTSNNKSSMYNVAQLANSVIVIDEIQAYPPKIWSKMVYIIEKYAEIFNIKFVLMSATLPKLDKLLGNDNKFINLISNKDNFFQNINFKNRVAIDSTYLRDNEKIMFDTIKDIVLSKSEEYFNDNGYINSLLGFIYKKDASDFSNMYGDIFKKLGYEVMVMSGTTMKPRSNRIISDIKNKKHLKVLLIATQCIEAGVDIDMDIGFKDVSVVDSEEQIMGRINRNASKKNSKIYLFNTDNKFIYEKDERYKSNNIYDDKYVDIIRNKDFHIVYDTILNKFNKINDSYSIKSLTHFINDISNNNHKKVSESFKIIEDNSANKQIFIPLLIPLSDLNNYIVPNNMKTDGYLDGEKVYEYHECLLKEKRFTDIKKFNKIFNLFVVNLYLSDKNYSKMLNFLSLRDINNNIHYLEDLSMYDYINGFDLSKIESDVKHIFI
jgi:CRISPR-associated endonuclease/helicase Cas3